MSQTVLTESQLHIAVEKLRSEHSNTLELYKAVAGLLFFQYDCTPTTNRMYQLVRKGSMSAPAEALRLFWQELRDRSQVRMQEADIPSSLKYSAGTLFAQMWEESLQIAKEMTETNNQAIYVQQALAQQEQAQLKQQLQAAMVTIAQRELEIEEKKEELASAQAELKASEKETLHVKAQVAQLEIELNRRENEHEQSLQLQKDQLLLSEQRAADMEKYARLEIERVRQESQKLLQQEQERAQQLHKKAEQLQSDYTELQKNYVTLQQKQLLESQQRQSDAKRYQQLESQNQDLHQLLQHVERELRAAHTNSERRPATPSRLARQRKASRYFTE